MILANNGSSTGYYFNETFTNFRRSIMKEKFEVVLLEEVRVFLRKIDKKASRKILYNIRKAKYLNDPRLFKKLNADLWEFRTEYANIQYRLLAFWDTRKKENSLVVATHGIIKKTSKIPRSDLEKAEKIRKIYFTYN